MNQPLVAIATLLLLTACGSGNDGAAPASADATAGAAGATSSGGAAGSTAAGAGGDAGANSGGAGGSSAGAAGAPAGGQAGSASFTDPRDGMVYPTARIGKQTWLAKNLAFDAQPGSFCYGDDPANCVTHGRLYTWAAAQSACPAGWHLGADEEWKALETSLGMADDQLALSGYSTTRGTVEGAMLKVGGSSGFDARLSGFRSGNTYEAIDDRSYFWVATTAAGGQAWRRRVEAASPTVFRFTNPTAGFAIIVRCVAD